MVKTVSTMQQLGQQAASFTLPNLTPDIKGFGSEVALADFVGQPLLVIFICNHCPYVVHLAAELAEFVKYNQAQGLSVVAINSNDVANYPQDAPPKMTEFAVKYAFQFPYCFDQTQAIAKAYGAACTPDFFLYNSAHELRYRGQFDASRPGNDVPVTGQDLQRAVDAVLASQPLGFEQEPSLGCNIKWRPENTPDYF